MNMNSIEHEERFATAADWLLRLRDSAVTPSEIAEWMAWCEANAENRKAFTQMQALWRQSGLLEEKPIDPADVEADTYVGQVSVEEWRLAGRAANPIEIERVRQTNRERSTMHRTLGFAAAAAIAVLTVAGGMWLMERISAPDTGELVLTASIGANRDVVLPDGTAVTIASGSHLTTRFDDSERNVYLESGEAFFKVKKDSRRPFMVHALDAKVTAIGTAFNIRAEEGIVRVAVTEGTVSIDRPPPAKPKASSADIAPLKEIRLVAGHQVTLTPEQSEAVIGSIDAGRATAWVTGTLRFVDEPLFSVVAAVNRYTKAPVILKSRELGELHYTGTVVTDRIDEWLHGLPDVFAVTVTDQGNSGVVIEPVLLGASPNIR